MRHPGQRWTMLAVLAALAALMPPAEAKDKKVKAAPKDEIAVVGHIPLSNGPVKRFLATQHFSSYYLYAEHEAGSSVTLIDVTKTDRPAVLADVAYAPTAGSDSLTLVA